MPDVEDRMRPPGGDLPHHVTTPLLALITERSLDEDYAHVAARRAAGNADPKTTSLGARTALVLAAFGVLAAIGAVQTSRDVDVQELSETALRREIAAGSKDVTRLQRKVQSLTAQNIAATEAAQELDNQAVEQEARLGRLELRTGAVAVRGPGVRIEVTSAPGADNNDQVRDTDLALLVNGLFAAGAEAVGINDERIIALGGIRNTSFAVHVNGRPLTPPYVIEAVGDRDALQSRLLESNAGLEWFRVVKAQEFGYVAQNVDEVVIPGARLPILRHTGGDNTPGRADEQGATP